VPNALEYLLVPFQQKAPPPWEEWCKADPDQPY
jgi:hypothetical protein